MSYTTTDEFAVLHALKVRGMSTAEPLAEGTGIPRLSVQQILDDAVARGLARSRTGGRVEGYMLTGQGQQRRSALQAEVVTAGQQDALGPVYEGFLPLNKDFKALTTDWQTAADPDVTGTVQRLRAVHADLGDLLKTAAGALPRMRFYRPRLDAALDRFAGGDTDALARPMSGSYHDVWMELHEDLLLTLERPRSEHDE